MISKKSVEFQSNSNDIFSLIGVRPLRFYHDHRQLTIYALTTVDHTRTRIRFCDPVLPSFSLVFLLNRILFIPPKNTCKQFHQASVCFTDIFSSGNHSNDNECNSILIIKSTVFVISARKCCHETKITFVFLFSCEINEKIISILSTKPVFNHFINASFLSLSLALCDFIEILIVLVCRAENITDDVIVWQRI